MERSQKIKITMQINTSSQKASPSVIKPSLIQQKRSRRVCNYPPLRLDNTVPLLYTRLRRFCVQ